MDPEAIEEIAVDINRLDVARHVDLVVPTRGGLMAGSRLDELLKELTGDRTFDNLRFPFACVAADILTGDEVPMEDGFVHEAMTVSYTHLDVYKRQPISLPIPQKTPAHYRSSPPLSLIHI